MRDAHLTVEDLRKLLEEDDLITRNRLILHHVAICPECRTVGGHLLELYEAGTISLEFCTIEIGLGLSRRDAPALWDELSRCSFEQQQALIRAVPRFRSWGLCELLCAESLGQAAGNPTTAQKLADLAVELAMALEEWEPAERCWLEELRGFAWAHLANAYRVLGDLPKADEVFATAKGWWTKGAVDAGDVLGYEVRMLDLEASLRHAQRRLPEARRLLEDALTIEETPAGRSRLLVMKAKVLEEEGGYKQAIEILEQAGVLLEVGEESRLLLCVEHNRIWLLTLCGRHFEAKLRLPEVARLSLKLGTELDQVRLRWVEGRIAYAFGDVSTALDAWGEVRTHFMAEQLAYDAALVSLELAALHAHLGEYGEAKNIAREILPLFGARQVSREFLASLSLFLQATEAETLTDELARQVIEYFRRTKGEERLSAANDAVQ